MFIDTHCHFSEREDYPVESVYERAVNSGVTTMINVGFNMKSSRSLKAFSDTHKGVYYAVGVHPDDESEVNEKTLAELYEMAKDVKCVAIGEIGLDYYWDKEHKEIQKEMLHAQLRLALELDKPVIIHDREAHADSLRVVKEFPGVRGVFHCYSGSVEMAQGLTKLGWMFSFGGSVTFVGGNTGREVCVQGGDPGSLELEVAFGDSTAMAPSFPLRVVEESVVKLSVWILSDGETPVREYSAQ